MVLSKYQRELIVERLSGDAAVKFVFDWLVEMGAAKKTKKDTKAVQQFVYDLREQLEELTLD